MASSRPVVAVIMGSDSDLEVMQRCIDQLRAFELPCEVRILSAHRTPAAVDELASSAADRGIRVIIAAAGLSAALAGAIAARTSLPVIGVAVPGAMMGGLDALLATVQMPPGVPVGCAGIGPAGAVNAAVLAAQIVALGDAALAGRLSQYKAELAEKTLAKDREIQGRGV